jgi:hypothetical protein
LLLGLTVLVAVAWMYVVIFETGTNCDPPGRNYHDADRAVIA